MSSRFDHLGIEAIEHEISNGSIEAMRYYGEQATRKLRHDQTELLRRKKILLEAPHGGHSHILRHVAMLAAITRDYPLAKFIVSGLEESGDPAMGYYVFEEAAANVSSPEDEARWEVLLRSSAAHGFILARKRVFSRKISRLGVVGLPLLLLHQLWLILVGVTIIGRNPRDLRLPPKRRPNIMGKA